MGGKQSTPSQPTAPAAISTDDEQGSDSESLTPSFSSSLDEDVGSDAEAPTGAGSPRRSSRRRRRARPDPRLASVVSAREDRSEHAGGLLRMVKRAVGALTDPSGTAKGSDLTYSNSTRRATLVFAWLECQEGMRRELDRGRAGEVAGALAGPDGEALGDDAFVVVREPVLESGRMLASLPPEIVREIALFLLLNVVIPPRYESMTRPVLVLDDPQLKDPQFLTVDPNTGNVIVADSGGEFWVFHPETGEVIRRIGDVGGCYSVATQSNSSIVANGKSKSVLQQYTPDGKKTDLSALTLKNPWGMCSNRETDYVYVACPLDGDTTRIQEFNESLVLQRRLETKDDWPHDVAVDASRQRLYTATTGGIVMIDLVSGSYVSKVVTLSVLSRPMGIDTDFQGTYLCVDQSGKSVAVFSPEHKVLHSIDVSFMKTPVGVAICPRTHRVYVSDEGQAKVFAFAPDDESPRGQELPNFSGSGS